MFFFNLSKLDFIWKSYSSDTYSIYISNKLKLNFDIAQKEDLKYIANA